ncbi:serine/threonine-protein kinase [Yersinia rochesterensis]|uniref:serine/threonine-protein kinase n=1 Tax=Yersinia rochesterensis TaxID=1604335 RepID=UPI00285347D4|nr:serine/threonine-protein kinase [Yersinia rochesterensis]MDR5017902.1 serine/threonine-protein kinase [Yersinia rochesterensis]
MLNKPLFYLCIFALPWPALFAEENLSLHSLTPRTITTQQIDSHAHLRLPIKVTARDDVVLEKMAAILPNVNSVSDPVFSQAMQLIDYSRDLGQRTWAQQFPEISDARVGRIVDLYLQLYDAEDVEHADSLEGLLNLRPGLTAAQGYEKARVISLDREIFFKLFQKGLTLSTEEELTPLAALSFVWWLQQEGKPTLAELSAAIYRAEHKDIRKQAAILYNHSHYGHRYGDIAGIPATDLDNWGMGQLDEPAQPVFSASKALRVIYEGMSAPPAIVQSPAAYLANGFAPKNAQGSYLTDQLPEMILQGCNLVGFDTCSQQDFTQFLALQHPVGSLAFSLKTTLNLHYQLQGKNLDELDGKDTEQLYGLLVEEEIHLQQAGGVRYSPTVIFLSHFSQSNEVEPLTVEQIARAFKHIAGEIDAADLPDSAQSTFIRLQQLADYIIDGTAIDLEQVRFVSDLKILAPFFELNPPLYALTQRGLYKTEQQKIARQLDYLDMRLAYRHPPAAFDEDQAIREILREKGVRDIYFPRQYTYRRDLQHGYPQKEFDSPFDEFKRRRNASNHFVANMSMPGNNGRPINVFDTLDAKKSEYYAQIKAHPALRAQAIEALIDSGERPKGSRLQHKIESLAEDYQPESENTRFWGNAWTSLENHWVCKVPLPNPMCTIARVESPRYRNDKEGMAAGMTAMMMEASLLKGMERGVKMIENPPPGIKVESIAEPVPTLPELSRQTIQNPYGTPIEVQWVRLKDLSVSSGGREAWVRQGGSGAYWEVDLATGKDLGVVLKQGPEFIKQGRLPGGGSSSSTLSGAKFNPEIKLGKKIGHGSSGDVFLDANNPGFVLKKLSTQESVLLTEVHMKEVEFFNRYYGEGSSEFIIQENQHYIRMYRVPGKTLAEITSNVFPPNAKERFLSMMDDLGYYNIIHDDLNFNNVLYDKKTNTFYPIDFDKAHDGYYSPRELDDGNQPWGVTIRVEYILEHIEKYTKK